MIYLTRFSTRCFIRLSKFLFGFILSLLFCLITNFPLTAAGLEDVDIFDLPLEQLFDLRVTTASGWDEALRDAPAAMVIISRKDIAQRGYSSIGEIFQDLPGFDSIGVDTTFEVNAYQRGYRTNGMTRTLIAINGVLDNHLWTHRLQTNHQYPMSSIERIEVLYGPAGAVYGPNAFLGVINIITRQPNHEANDNYLETTLSLSEYDTQGVDIAGGGQLGALNFNLGLQYYSTEGTDLADYAPWGFNTERWLNDNNSWGPILKLSTNGSQYGQYLNPTDDWGILGEMSYQDTKLGVILWQSERGYGQFYAFDHAQPNASWITGSRQFYLQNKTAFNDQLSLKTLLKYRINDFEGDWAEALPDWNEGLEAFSYVSLSRWNTESSSWKLREDFDYQASDQLQLSGGLKYERKDLTRAYDICNYYTNAFCSSGDGSNQGPHDLGPGIFHTTDPKIIFQPDPLSHIPDENTIMTTDKGAYIQVRWSLNDWRFGGGFRWDHNSEYGSFTKPRMSVIHHFSDQTTIKLIHAQAFQEPPPQQLYGGWTGRRANPDLKPEEVKNTEIILMHQQNNWSHDMSLYHTRYHNVVKEEAENAGERDVTGFEYRGKYQFANPFTSGPDISGNLYYSWTNAKSAIYYDHDNSEWLDGDAELGDIARHKISAAINFPYSDSVNINLKANWVDDRPLYQRNRLREQGKKAASYTTVDITTNWDLQPFTLKLKITNLFNQDYYHPGGEQADSGDDFSQRAQGFRNSLIPQRHRQWLLMASYTF